MATSKHGKIKTTPQAAVGEAVVQGGCSAHTQVSHISILSAHDSHPLRLSACCSPPLPVRGITLRHANLTPKTQRKPSCHQAFFFKFQARQPARCPLPAPAAIQAGPYPSPARASAASPPLPRAPRPRPCCARPPPPNRRPPRRAAAAPANQRPPRGAAQPIRSALRGKAPPSRPVTGGEGRGGEGAGWPPGSPIGERGGRGEPRP